MTTKLVLVAAAATISATAAQADVIQFTHDGSGSGSIGGVPFTNTDFTITAVGDTGNRISFGSGFAIQHNNASIAIDGVGTFDFSTLTRTFVNTSSGVVGFSRSEGNGSEGLDLFNGPLNSAFNAWDMLSSIGPISGDDGTLIQWASSPVQTSGGVLEFNSESDVAVTFEAFIPAPGSMAVCAMAGLVAVRRRRSMAARA